MEPSTKSFHFQEINWVISFPAAGNSGKYRSYTVSLREQNSGGASEEKQTRLGEVLDRAELDGHYPHTVGYYKTSWEGKPQYLEFREIRTVEEFWCFLNALCL
jgi:hypothetical protein